MDLGRVGAATAVAGTSADMDGGLDGVKAGAELSNSIWAPAIGGGGKPALKDGPLPASLSTDGFMASVAGVSAVAADNVTSVAVVGLGTAASSPTGTSNPAGFENEARASGAASVTGGVNSGEICGMAGISDAGEASVAGGPTFAAAAAAAAASAAFAFSAALLSISSIRRCIIRGISCT